MAAAVDVTQFIGEPPTERRRSKTISDSAFDRAKDEAQRRMRDGEWEGAGPSVFVAVFSLAHERIYGIEATDLTPTDRLKATFVAARVLKKDFGDDASEMANFVRWAWSREEWFHKQGRGSSRLTWGILFSARKVCDYRVAMAREAKKAKR